MGYCARKRLEEGLFRPWPGPSAARRAARPCSLSSSNKGPRWWAQLRSGPRARLANAGSRHPLLVADGPRLPRGWQHYCEGSETAAASRPP